MDMAGNDRSAAYKWLALALLWRLIRRKRKNKEV